MQTSDFNSIGSFFVNQEKKIAFLSKAEIEILSKNGFLQNTGFEQFESAISGVYYDHGCSVADNVFIAKALPFVTVPVFIDSVVFPDLLGISFERSYSYQESYFPLSQVCKALSLEHREDFVPFKTEQRLSITDYGTKLPASGDIVVFQTSVKGFKTVFPKSFDSWVKLLLKAKEFKTLNREFLLIKSLFDIK